MNEVSQDDLGYLQSLLNSLQFEINKGRKNGGFVCLSYMTEKIDKMKKVIEEQKKKK